MLAIILAMILAAANAYLGLFAGLTIATAIPAAVVSMGVLRLLGGGTILENNIVQTGASAGSSIAAGVIFTIPALIILGYWQDFRYSWVLAIAGLGGLLGVLFSVPLRRTMIVEEPLPFPEGKAAAEVLKAGENPGPGLKILAHVRRDRRGGEAGCGKRPAHDSRTTRSAPASSASTSATWAPTCRRRCSASATSSASTSASSWCRAAILSLATSRSRSTTRSSWTAIRRSPRSVAGAGAADIAGAIWSAKIRYLGVGAMLIGGVWTLFSLRKSLVSGIRSGFAAARKGNGRGRRRNRARPADEVDADRAGGVRDSAGAAVPGDRRHSGASASR